MQEHKDAWMPGPGKIETLRNRPAALFQTAGNFFPGDI